MCKAHGHALHVVGLQQTVARWSTSSTKLNTTQPSQPLWDTAANSYFSGTSVKKSVPQSSLKTLCPAISQQSPSHDPVDIVANVRVSKYIPLHGRELKALGD